MIKDFNKIETIEIMTISSQIFKFNIKDIAEINAQIDTLLLSYQEPIAAQAYKAKNFVLVIKANANKEWGRRHEGEDAYFVFNRLQNCKDISMITLLDKKGNVIANIIPEIKEVKEQNKYESTKLVSDLGFPALKNLQITIKKEAK